jgi:hypothetical protein
MLLLETSRTHKAYHETLLAERQENDLLEHVSKPKVREVEQMSECAPKQLPLLFLHEGLYPRLEFAR